jgi:S1-C subfamily serine protease
LSTDGRNEAVLPRARRNGNGSFTTLLAALAVLNIVVVLFILMGVGWEQLAAVPSGIVERLKSKDHPRLPTRSTTLTTPNLQPTLTAGVVTDPNLQLVCSDETFSSAIAKVRPAVVSIACDSIEPTQRPPGFLRFDDPAGDLAALGGIGSGIVLDPHGYILTCLHVVAKASNVYVTPFGSTAKRLAARVVARDEGLNLAVLKVSPSYELPVATTGESARMEVADYVLAVGSPFGLEQSVTHGIVSDNERDLQIDGRIYRGMMQTDVPINRGSSGGPLINLSGEVIGVNMAIYSTTGVYHGVSFAMPIDKAKPFLARAMP